MTETITGSPKLDVSFLTLLQKQAMRKHVETVVMCPLCGARLNPKQAVELDKVRDGQLLESLICCAECWDTLCDLMPGGWQVDIVDGRKLWPGRWD